MKCTNTFYPPLLSILRMGSVCVETRCMGVFGAVSRDTWLRVSATRSQRKGGVRLLLSIGAESNINFREIYTSASVAEREGGAGYFPSEQSHDTYASPSVQVMHACSLVRSNWQSVCEQVYLRKLQLSKTHFAKLAAHFVVCMILFWGKSTVLIMPKLGLFFYIDVFRHRWEI